MSGSPAAFDPSPVEAYLDQLLVALRGHPRQIRHQLAEAEAHLRDASAEGVARGLTQDEAETEAVARFGPADILSAAEAHRQHRSMADIVTDGVRAGWWLGSLGAIAVGISGVLAALTTAIWGQTFTAGRPPGSVQTAADCARWLANTHAASCTQAGTADWAHDTVLFRAALGVLGLLALGVGLLWRRRTMRSSRSLAGGLPATVVDTVAVAAFGAAGVWLVGQTVDTLVVSAGRGAGQWLSAAPVALALAVVFGVRLLRDVRAADVTG